MEGRKEKMAWIKFNAYDFYKWPSDYISEAGVVD